MTTTKIKREQVVLKTLYTHQWPIASGEDDLNHIIDPDGRNKPKPYIYQAIAESLDVRPDECIVFEDTYAGVEAAAAAGMWVFGTPNRFTTKHDFSKAISIINFKDTEPKKLLNSLINSHVYQK